MNRNIFLRKQGGQGLSYKSTPTSTTDNDVEKDPLSTKYNPDVMKNYDKIKDYKIGNISYTNKTWKGITGESLFFNPDCSENFLIPKEEVSIVQMKSEYENEYLIREKERLRIEEKNRMIKEQMMENVMQMVDEICDDNNDVNIDDMATFDELKLDGKGVAMTTEQNDYNKLLGEISNL